MTDPQRVLSRPRADRAAAYAISDAARTDRGLVRSSNEDAFVRRSEARLWAVADGMGGHEDGEWASHAIARSIEAAPMTGEFDADCAALAAAVRQAHGLIHDRAERLRLRMGSTVVALLLRDDRFAVLWVGDSRAYRLRAGRLAQLTTDHTQVQSKVARGLLTPEEARSHPMAHVLSRAVGVEAVADAAGVQGTVESGDLFLLCSDGLHGVATDSEIAQALERATPAEACDRLLGLSLARGAPDNVTVVAVAVGR